MLIDSIVRDDNIILQFLELELQSQTNQSDHYTDLWQWTIAFYRIAEEAHIVLK